MLRFIYAHDLAHFPVLARGMFRDRADQFKRRLGWEVSVDAAGEERDEYDALDPLYVIWQRSDGQHGGSMRLLPTTGRTMLNDHFAHLLPDGPVRDPQLWECTRFCLAPGAESHVAAALMLGGGEVLRGMGLSGYTGVFDARMERIYRFIGSSPQVIGAIGSGRDRISAGIWIQTDADRAKVAHRARVSPEISALWFHRAALPTVEERPLVAA
ncbi:autoinducer synthase [Roseovarius spongiae]|uniref:Acyl-homoserine-lactone synthase n=1 Tax=Roseovarius spongiae TaxID=2320272 RepID=A0A3A8ATT0_9RHOB|nr:acyl-homoserine-lactone synthase [Roseovarius spongiae]RKF14091.1 autoinducer synthase [Roseovarius spongiae]